MEATSSTIELAKPIYLDDFHLEFPKSHQPRWPPLWNWQSLSTSMTSTIVFPKSHRPRWPPLVLAKPHLPKWPPLEISIVSPTSMASIRVLAKPHLPQWPQLEFCKASPTSMTSNMVWAKPHQPQGPPLEYWKSLHHGLNDLFQIFFRQTARPRPSSSTFSTKFTKWLRYKIRPQAIHNFTKKSFFVTTKAKYLALDSL